MKHKFLKLFIVTFIIAAAYIGVTTMLSGAVNDDTDRLETARQSGAKAQDIGQGGTIFRFEMLDLNDNFLVWNVSTEETMVGAALLYLGLISGEAGTFGLFVTEVNGVAADFAADNTWWAFFVDGESAIMGVDETIIEQGRTYTFVLTEN